MAKDWEKYYQNRRENVSILHKKCPKKMLKCITYCRCVEPETSTRKHPVYCSGSTIGFWPVMGKVHGTFESVPVALSACGFLEIAFHSTPASCFPWLYVLDYSPFAPLSFPTLPLAGHSAGRSFVPVWKT